MNVLDAQAAVHALSRGDAVVVLSHEPPGRRSRPRPARESRTGYVGALGSRRTQQRRATWLTHNGLTPAALSRLRGAAGLDIGARTPHDIAVSILASPIGRGWRAVAGPSGPVHIDGLLTPRRYDDDDSLLRP